MKMVFDRYDVSYNRYAIYNEALDKPFWFARFCYPQIRQGNLIS